VNFWRFKNRINILLKSRTFLEQKGIQPDKILPDVFVPLLEDASNTEHTTLSGMFASLLSSHLDPATQADVHPAFTKILSQLSSLDATVVQQLFFDVNSSSAPYREYGLNLAGTCVAFQIPDSVALLSFENLWRLGVCDRSPDPLAFINRGNQVCFTDYGWSFARACLKHES